MNKSRNSNSIKRIQKTIDISTLVASGIFAVILIIVGTWNSQLHGAAPTSLIYAYMVTMALTWMLGIAYCIIWVGMRIYARKK